MPLELGTALSIEREQIDDPEIRVHALEAIYMIILQVSENSISFEFNEMPFLLKLKTFYLFNYLNKQKLNPNEIIYLLIYTLLGYYFADEKGLCGCILFAF